MWSLSKTEHQWEDLLCRWRRRLVVGKPALLSRNLKSFKGVFSHPVGFCFHKNVVRIGRLHDGVMLHHTVDAWRRPQKMSNNNNQPRQIKQMWRLPTRFPKQPRQDVIVWLFLTLWWILFTFFFRTSPFFHQMRNAMTFESTIPGVLAFFVLAPISGVTVFSLFPVFFCGCVLVIDGQGCIFVHWLSFFGVSGIIFPRGQSIYRNVRLYIQSIVSDALTVHWLELSVFTGWRHAAIVYRRNISWV